MNPKVDIMTYKPSDIKGPLKSRLKQLTLLPRGLMWSYFTNATDDARVIVARSDRRIHGWCLLFNDPKTKQSNCVHIFVDHRDRREGIGTQLLMVVHEEVKKSEESSAVVFSWNKISLDFYNKVGNKIPINNHGWYI